MRNILFLILLVLIIGSCKPETSDAPAPVKTPAKAMLLLPAQNEPCTNGLVVSSTQSTIQFKWNKADNTDAYDLVLKNLESGAITTHPAAANTQIDLTIARNMPFSWYIVSKSSSSSATIQSDTWKFYNAGPADVSYAPYPADAMVPALGANVTATGGKITLDWNGGDADNDIVSYDVFFGTTNTPALLSGNVVNSILPDVTVASNTLYYWKVITKDAKGNKSDSGIYQFRVN